MAPVDREFGSPDYESLTALDQAAFAAVQSWERVRDWLATPNPQLEGIRPEDAARNPEGLSKVMSTLMLHGSQASNDFMRKAEKMSTQERDALNGLTDIKSLKGMFGRPSKRASIEDRAPWCQEEIAHQRSPAQLLCRLEAVVGRTHGALSCLPRLRPQTFIQWTQFGEAVRRRTCRDTRRPPSY